MGTFLSITDNGRNMKLYLVMVFIFTTPPLILNVWGRVNLVRGFHLIQLLNMHTRKRYYLITTIIRNKDTGDIKTDTETHLYVYTCICVHTHSQHPLKGLMY